MEIDLAKWGRVARPQPEGKPWCWAASLSSVARFQLDTEIDQTHLILMAFGDVNTDERPDWGKYCQILDHLQDHGVEYSRTQAGRRKLQFTFDLQHNFDTALAMREIQAGYPVITTIQGGAHDLVVIGLTVAGSVVQVVHYWNPGDNGIGHLTLDSFNALGVVCTLAARVTPVMEQIAFTSGGFLH